MPKKIKYNPADRMADLAMMRMQGRIKKVYAEAEQDITKKLNAFIARFREKDAEYQAGVKAGKIAQADYDAWRRGQIFQGKRWRAMRQEMTEQIYRANKTAAGIINGERRVVFQQNANYLAYQIEKGTRGAVSFGLYDSATVTRLLKEDRKLLPEYKINQRKDYKWNNQKVNSAVTQSIVQGESIDALAKRMTTSLEAGNRSHMLNFARTAMTGAQNAGRIEAMHDAEDMGIKVQKRWIATLDSRTRDTHAELDGQVVDVDKPFEVDGMTIMYPGDPNADPSLVYNCRCTLGYEYPEYSGQGKRLDNETGNVIEYTTYKDWEKSKQGGQTQQMDEPEKPKDYGEVANALLKTLETTNIERRTVEPLQEKLETDQIIERLGGGDQTKGSCASLSFAYAGNKCGYDVLDFRGGESQNFFSYGLNVSKIASMDGVVSKEVREYNDFKAAATLVTEMKENKEYILSIGKHAAIVRKNGERFQYLELQSESGNGWNPLTNNTLKWRFGCKKSHTLAGQKLTSRSSLIEVESLGNNEGFREILEYINTSASSQKKGVGGHER